MSARVVYSCYSRLIAHVFLDKAYLGLSDKIDCATRLEIAAS